MFVDVEEESSENDKFVKQEGMSCRERYIALKKKLAEKYDRERDTKCA